MLNYVSKLTGFAKKNELKYCLNQTGGINYIHITYLVPTKDNLDDYKKNKGVWGVYEEKFFHLISERQIENKVTPELINHGCLLCSEAKPHNCHRRLVAEYLQNSWGNVDIKHL